MLMTQLWSQRHIVKGLHEPALELYTQLIILVLTKLVDVDSTWRDWACIHVCYCSPKNSSMLLCVVHVFIGCEQTLHVHPNDSSECTLP